MNESPERSLILLLGYIDTGVGEIVAKVKAEKHVLENILQNFRENPYDALNHFLNKQDDRKSFVVSELRKRMQPFMNKEELDAFENQIDQNKDGEIGKWKVSRNRLMGLDSVELKQVLDDIKQKASNKNDHHEAEDITTRVFLRYI